MIYTDPSSEKFIKEIMKVNGYGRFKEGMEPIIAAEGFYSDPNDIFVQGPLEHDSRVPTFEVFSIVLENKIRYTTMPLSLLLFFICEKE